MKTFAVRFLLILICICMCGFLLTGCGEEAGIAETDDLPAVIEPMDNSWLNEISGKTAGENSAQIPEYSGGDTAVIGASLPLDYINPFYAESSDERTASELVSVRLVELDREGNAVLSGASGESRVYNGTEYTYDGIADVDISGNTCTIRLNEDIYFSDGVNLTADDVIFTMYVLADPAYDGPLDFAQLPVMGLEEYRSGMIQQWRAILNDMDGAASVPDGALYTQAERDDFINAFNTVGIEFTKDIVKKCVDTFAKDYCGFVLNRSFSDVMGNQGLQTAFAEYFCGYASGYDGSEDGLWHDASGKVYDLSGSFPTVEDLWNLIVEKHGYDISDDGINYERLGDEDFETLLKRELDEKYSYLTVAVGGEASPDSISGIEKIGMYSIKITFTESPAEYAGKLTIPVCPLHYYGSRDEYRYTENSFGFSKGDITAVKACSKPLGAGAYVFDRYENGAAVFVRNPLYYRGCPYITYVLLGAGEPDIAEGSGDISVASGRFEYIGINGARVSVCGDVNSDASVCLRKAFCTLFEAYRAESAAEYGELEISCPAAPGYAVSSSGVTAADRALNDAVELLKQAGYVWNEASKTFTSAPEGASLSYELRICRDDPAAKAAYSASEALAEVGITLTVTQHSSMESLKNFVGEGGADMWAVQAQGSAGDVLRTLFHSSGAGSVFGISSNELDDKIEGATAFRRSVRNAYYREIFEGIMEAGVIVPICEETDKLYCSGAVDRESLPQDMTLYHTWIKEVWRLKMN